MIWEDSEKIKSYLEEEAGMVPCGGVGETLSYRVLGNLDISDLTKIWDFLETKGVICSNVFETSDKKYSLKVLHSNEIYLVDKLNESLINLRSEE